MSVATDIRYEECHVNSVIAHQILPTIPVTVASGERNFSKLKLIKTYITSTMTEERLTDLAQISIETDVSSSLDFEPILTAFAQWNARTFALNKLESY